MHLSGGPRWGSTRGPLGPRELAGAWAWRDDGEASGLWLPPKQALLVFHAHFCQSPPGVSPNTELPRLALISRKGTVVPLGYPSRSFPAARPGQAGRCLAHVSRFRAAPRPGTAPPRVTMRAGDSLPPPHRLPTWGTCREMPGRGGFLSVARLLSGAGGCGRRAPPSRVRTPPPCAADALGSQWAPRRWACWRLSPSRGRERGDRECASCRRATGRGGGAAGGGAGGAAEQLPEDHCSPRLRRTDAGPTPATPRPRPPA